MPFAELRQAVKTSTLESSLGILLVIIGGALTLAPTSSMLVRPAGYAVSSIGTLLTSWALTKSWIAREHRRELTATLQTIMRPLSTVVSQLTHAVGRAGSDPEGGVDIEVVQLSIQHLFGVLSDLQAVAGSPLSMDDVLAVKARLDILARELAAEGEEEVESPVLESSDARLRLQRVAEEVNSLKSQLDAALTKKDREQWQETLACPGCKAANRVALGSSTGDSALPTCSSCGTRFHAHRAADGSAFTKPWGGSTEVLSLKLSCPNCHGPIPLSVAKNHGPIVMRFCLACFAKLQIDPSTRAIAIARPAEAPLEGTLGSNRQGISCPICAKPWRIMYSRDGVFFAVCGTDDKLLRARELPPPNLALVGGSQAPAPPVA